jgi:hypothetical protein
LQSRTERSMLKGEGQGSLNKARSTNGDAASFVKKTD